MPRAQLLLRGGASQHWAWCGQHWDEPLLPAATNTRGGATNASSELHPQNGVPSYGRCVRVFVWSSEYCCMHFSAIRWHKQRKMEAAQLLIISTPGLSLKELKYERLQELLVATILVIYFANRRWLQPWLQISTGPLEWRLGICLALIVIHSFSAKLFHVMITLVSNPFVTLHS